MMSKKVQKYLGKRQAQGRISPIKCIQYREPIDSKLRNIIRKLKDNENCGRNSKKNMNKLKAGANWYGRIRRK